MKVKGYENITINQRNKLTNSANIVFEILKNTITQDRQNDKVLNLITASNSVSEIMEQKFRSL